MLLFPLVGLLSAQERRELPSAESMYQQSCASCHDTGADRAPQRQVLRAMSAEGIVNLSGPGIICDGAVGGFQVISAQGHGSPDRKGSESQESVVLGSC